MNICLKLDVNVLGDSGYASPPRLVEYEEAETLCVKPINDLGKRLKTVQLGSSSSTGEARGWRARASTRPTSYSGSSY